MQIPLAMDAIGSFVVAASAPLDIRVWRVDTQPASKLTSNATTTLTLVRELSIMSVGQPLRVRTFLLPNGYAFKTICCLSMQKDIHIGFQDAQVIATTGIGCMLQRPYAFPSCQVPACL